MKQLISKTSHDFKNHVDERGSLWAFNNIDSFKTERIFYVCCKKDHWRGKHYHKKTTQIIFVIAGEIKVKVTDVVSGEVMEYFMQLGSSFRQEPFLQFEFCANTDTAEILVLCDSPHDVSDYY